MSETAQPGPRPLAARALQGVLFALIAGVVFQCLNVSVKTLAHELPPLMVAWGRWLTGLALIAPFVLRDGLGGLRTKDLKLHGLRALFHTSGYALWYSAIALIPLATTAALSFSGPIFVTLGAALFLGENVRWQRWLAVLTGFIGVLVILRPGLAAIEPGALIMLLAVPLIAGSNLVAKVVAGLCFAPFGLWFWQTPTLMQALLFLAAGFTGTVAYLFMTWAFRLLDISAVQPLTFLGIVWATLFDWLVFDALADAWTFVGAAIIVSASSFIARRESAVRAQRIA
jgi:drug/metabolite transporter (DMT)-like permease